MSDVLLESIRTAVLLCILGCLWWVGRKRAEIRRRGWWLIFGGFVLLLFGSAVDITDNFEQLNRLVLLGDTPAEAFLEKIVGFLGGFLLLACGLVRWIPTVTTGEALRESEARFRQLFDNMSSGVAVYEARDDGQDFIFVDFNQAGERIDDVKKESLIGQSVLDVFPGVKELGLFEVFQRVWRTGESEHHPVSLYKDERVVGWRENYVYKLPSGEIVAVYDDITARVRAAEETRQRTAQLEALREVGLEIARQLDLDALLHSVVARAIELLDGTQGGLYLYRPDRDVLEWTVGVNTLFPVGTVLHRGEGLSGRVWESGEPMTVDNYRRWEGRAAVYEGASFTSVVAAPICRGDEFLGVLNVAGGSVRTFSEADVELLSMFATQAAIAIRNAHLMQAEQEQRELAEALDEAAAAVSGTLDVEQVLDHILEQVERVVGGDAACFMLIEGDHARVVRWRGYERFGAEEFVSTATFRISNTPNLRRMLESGEAMVIPDIAAHPKWVHLPWQGWLRSYAGVPIRLRGQVIGFLNVDSATPDSFSPAHTRLLQSFANHAASAIENARLHGELLDRAERLKQRVQERTRDLERRSVQLRVAAEVARDATAAHGAAHGAAQEMDDLLNRAVNLVRDRFGFYHAGIFLVEEADSANRGKYAVLKAATGEAGRQMLERHHKLEVGKVGIVGYATGMGQPRIALDVGADAVHFKNPLLPETRSEMALPLKVGDRVIGALDVQSIHEAAFDDEDVAILQTMADQLAVAIERLARSAELKAQYARLDAILSSVADGIVVTDEGGNIVQANPVAQAWLTQTLSPGEADQLLGAVRDAAARVEEEPADKADRSGRVHPAEVLELTGLDLEVKAAPISEPGEEQAGSVVAIHDVSHLKALDRMKTRFITNISHELRTPITTIKLYTHLMQQGPEKWREYIDVLAEEANRQSRLLEGILQISRIDAGRLEMEPRPISLDDVAETVVAIHRALAQERGLTLEYRPLEPSPVVLVDPEWMVQVLNNLVENGIRYTPEGAVTVSTGTQEAEGRTWATVTVADTGMGIPEDELPHVFDRFFRGDEPRAMQLTGTGLGLSIVEEIVELHGGRVTVQSAVGEGSTFTVILPICSE